MKSRGNETNPVVAVLSTLLCLLAASALPAQNLGKIDFPVSVSGPAQERFIEGVLYLHNFEFEDAREEFKAAQALQPDFAMAYWGEAMTHNHPLWRQVDQAAGKAVLRKLGASLRDRLDWTTDERERGFLRAVDALYFTDGDKAVRDQAYSDAMRELHERYPKDHEAASFYALSILGLTDGVRDFRNYMKAASIVEVVFDENPRHPGAVHYLIHSYDDPIHAPLGLRPAAVYARIAPAASHAQHMVSHIYVALGQWDQATEANEKAWAVSKARAERKKLDVGQLDFHSFYWLHYSYLQQGRYEKAGEMLKVVEEAAAAAERGRLGSYYGRMRAQQAVEAPAWKGQLPPSEGGFFDLFADAYLALHAGGLEEAEGLLGRMSPDGTGERIMKTEIEALLRHKRGDSESALSLLKEAVASEDEMPLSYGPPLPAKPSHELLGELLLETDRPGEAVLQFQAALQRAPRRALSLMGLARAAERAGMAETAGEARKTLRDVWRNAESVTVPKRGEATGSN